VRARRARQGAYTNAKSLKFTHKVAKVLIRISLNLLGNQF